jgi:hypothetical protein
VSIERWPPLSFKKFQIHLASSNYVITNCKYQVVNVALTQSPNPKLITNLMKDQCKFQALHHIEFLFTWHEMMLHFINGAM